MSTLEALMICIDNSEWMRNGDYSPSRMEAQKETITFLTNQKLDSNQESTVGVMTMAGKRIDVLVSPCRTSGAIVKAVTKDVKIDGKINFSAALKTAQLVLKNRQNKNQKQRIIAFVGSPVEESTDDLVALGKKLSRLNIAVDVVLFGQESQDSRDKLDAFINGVQNAGNSHLCVVPPGPHDMSDLVLPTLMAGMTAPAPGAPGAAVPGAPAAAGGFPPGPGEAPIQGADGRMVDPRLDPETALAIRMSMEEEYQRQQKLAKDNKAAGAASAPAVASGSSSAASSAASASKPAAAPKPVSQTPAPAAGAKPTPAAPSKVKDDDEMEDEEDEDLKAAMALSMQPGEEPEAAKDNKQAKPAEGAGKKGEGDDQGVAAMEDVASVLQDPEFLSNLLKESGVTNVSVDSLLNELGEEADEEEDENK